MVARVGKVGGNCTRLFIRYGVLKLLWWKAADSQWSAQWWGVHAQVLVLWTAGGRNSTKLWWRKWGCVWLLMCKIGPEYVHIWKSISFFSPFFSLVVVIKHSFAERLTHGSGTLLHIALLQGYIAKDQLTFVIYCNLLFFHFHMNEFLSTQSLGKNVGHWCF